MECKKWLESTLRVFCSFTCDMYIHIFSVFQGVSEKSQPNRCCGPIRFIICLRSVTSTTYNLTEGGKIGDDKASFEVLPHTQVVNASERVCRTVVSAMGGFMYNRETAKRSQNE